MSNRRASACGQKIFDSCDLVHATQSTHFKFVLDNGVTGLRVLMAMFDPEGRAGSVSDLVSLDGGRRQMTAGGRIESDGRMLATYWLTEGDRHTPRALTAEEQDGLRRLAAALRQRCDPLLLDRTRYALSAFGCG